MMYVKDIDSWAEKRSKPDHDPHGEVNAHLSTFGCDFCGDSGALPTAVGDEMYLHDEEVHLACPRCDPDSETDGNYTAI